MKQIHLSNQIFTASVTANFRNLGYSRTSTLHLACNGNFCQQKQITVANRFRIITECCYNCQKDIKQNSSLEPDIRPDIHNQGNFVY